MPAMLVFGMSAMPCGCSLRAPWEARVARDYRITGSREGKLEFIGGGDEVSRKAAGVGQLMLLGIDRKSKTGDEPQNDEGDDEVEEARAFLITFHRILHVKELR